VRNRVVAAGAPGTAPGVETDSVRHPMEVSGLCTDLYEIRMAASYLRRDMRAPATFSLFVRELPADRGFLVAAGLADCLSLLAGFGFAPEDLHYLRHVVGLTGRDLDALARLRFTGDVWAVREGELVFAGEPLLEVTAPIAEAQLVETALVNLVTFQTSVATKAARCRLAAPTAELVDFAARRTHGLGAAMSVARCCALAGFAGTSYVAAARRYGLRPVGTMAHSYVQAFGDERAAFHAFAVDFPESAVFLVDTYDTVAGVRAAIDVAHELGLPGGSVGVRLDSGDLAGIAARTRRVLDQAGLAEARIMASGGLDEFALARLSGAPIDLYGIGTRLGVSADAPSLDSTYKLVAYAGRPVLKLSPGKATVPGAKQVFRGAAGVPDVVGLRDEPIPPQRRRLLVPVLRAGRRLAPAEPLATAADRLRTELAAVPEAARRLHRPTPVAVRQSAALLALTERTRAACCGHGVGGG
jgi:nicotinate phosphoribosyltransferase